MEPKFIKGQYVSVKKAVWFMFHNFSIRPGEVGKVLEVDIFMLDISGNFAYDYIVMIRNKPLFFYEEELEPYPKEE